MKARNIKLFYHPVLKGAREPTREQMQHKITTYLTYHLELKPQKHERGSCFKLSPGSSHGSVECYLIVSTKLLKEPEGSKDTIHYSNKELHNYIKKGILLI